MGQHVIGFFSLSQFTASNEIHHSRIDKCKQCLLFLFDNVIKTAANQDNSYIMIGQYIKEPVY